MLHASCMNARLMRMRNTCVVRSRSSSTCKRCWCMFAGCRQAEKRYDCTSSCAQCGRGATAALTVPETAQSAGFSATLTAKRRRRYRSAGSCSSGTLSSTPSTASLQSLAGLCSPTSLTLRCARTRIPWNISSTPPQTALPPSSRYNYAVSIIR